MTGSAKQSTTEERLDAWSLLAMTASRALPSLQKTLRIDIDLELKVALRLRTSGEPFAQILRQIDAARRRADRHCRGPNPHQPRRPDSVAENCAPSPPAACR